MIDMTASRSRIAAIAHGRHRAVAAAASCRFLVRPTMILFIVYLVAFSAIILANYNYIDDIGRVVRGYQGWENFSRFTSNFLSQFMHTSSYLTDISPLTQIVASFELALAGVLSLFVITGRREYSVWMIIATLPLGLSPYFLECISYKFDSPYMALSVLASVAPLILMGRNKVLYFAAVTVGEIVVCTTYQAASGILPMLVLVVACLRWTRGEKSASVVTFVVVSAVAYMVGLLVFKTCIMVPVESYVSNGLPPVADLMQVTVDHFKLYLKFVLADFRRLWMALCLLVVVSFILVIAANSVRGKIRSGLIALLCTGLMGCFVFGIYPVLSNPLFAPRAMYGVGAFLAFLSIGIASSRWSFVGNLATAALCWCFLVFSFTYGNALAVQGQWTDFRISGVINELASLEQFNANEVKTVQIMGSIGHAPALAGTIEHNPALARLVPVTFKGGWKWGIEGLRSYYGLSNARIVEDGDLTASSLPLLVENLYFDIYGEGTNFLVVLK